MNTGSVRAEMPRGDFDVYPNTATYNAVIKVGQGVGWMINVKVAMAVKQHSIYVKYCRS